MIESYTVDVPLDSYKEDTCLFADTIIRYNFKSLTKLTEKMTCFSLTKLTEKMTCFADIIIRYNLKSLTKFTEKMTCEYSPRRWLVNNSENKSKFVDNCVTLFCVNFFICEVIIGNYSCFNRGNYYNNSYITFNITL